MAIDCTQPPINDEREMSSSSCSSPVLRLMSLYLSSISGSFSCIFFFFTTSADRFRRYDVAYCLMDSGHIRPNRHGNELRLRLPIALPVLDPFSSNQQCQRVSFLVFLFVPLPNVFFLASFYNAETFLIRCDEKKNSFRSCHGAFLLEPMNSSHRHIDASSMPPPKSVR